MNQMRQVFERLYNDNGWKNPESRSGPGSTMEYTVNLRRQLPVFCEKYAIKKLLDAPCGDFNWMKAVEFLPSLTYVGGDISTSLVKSVKMQFADGNRTFIDFDITRDRFPEADVWFCRDCLYHLPFKDILASFINFVSSDIKFIFTTTHVNCDGFKNTDSSPGGFRPLDFFSEPFCLPRDVLFRVADYVSPWPPREMCVWTRSQIAAGLSTMYYKIIERPAPRRKLLRRSPRTLIASMLSPKM